MQVQSLFASFTVEIHCMARITHVTSLSRMWIPQQDTDIAEEVSYHVSLSVYGSRFNRDSTRLPHVTRRLRSEALSKDLRAALHVLGRLGIQGFHLFRHIC